MTPQRQQREAARVMKCSRRLHGPGSIWDGDSAIVHAVSSLDSKTTACGKRIGESTKGWLRLDTPDAITCSSLACRAEARNAQA